MGKSRCPDLTWTFSTVSSVTCFHLNSPWAIMQCDLGASMQQLKLLSAVPVLAAPLQIRLPADIPVKAMEDGSSVQTHESK